MKMPPEFRGHRFFNFSNHFAFIRSFADLLVSFALLLVNSAGSSTHFMIMKGIYF